MAWVTKLASRPSVSIDGDGAPTWIGDGLRSAGIQAGETLEEEGQAAARLLLKGCDPRTGARWVRPSQRVHPDARLPGRHLVQELTARAAAQGVEPGALLQGRPTQQRALVQLTRMVGRSEAHRVPFTALHRLARAAGVDLAEVYEQEELATAYAHRNDRVENRTPAWTIVLDVPKSDSIVHGLMPEGQGCVFRGLLRRAAGEAFAQFEQWTGYGVSGDIDRRVRMPSTGLMAFSVEHWSALPVKDRAPDPHLSFRLVVFNLTLCEDGKWRSIANGGRDLYRHARALDGLFKARVRALTYERWGTMRLHDPRTGAWEISGVPRLLRKTFSRRSAQITAEVGLGASREVTTRVAARLQQPREGLTTPALRAEWRHRARSAGADVKAVLEAALPGPPATSREVCLPSPGQLAGTLFRPGGPLCQAVFSRAQLLADVAHALPQGIGGAPGALEHLTDQVLAADGLVDRLPHRGEPIMSSVTRYRVRASA